MKKINFLIFLNLWLLQSCTSSPISSSTRVYPSSTESILPKNTLQINCNEIHKFNISNVYLNFINKEDVSWSVSPSIQGNGEIICRVFGKTRSTQNRYDYMVDHIFKRDTLTTNKCICEEGEYRIIEIIYHKN